MNLRTSYSPDYKNKKYKISILIYIIIRVHKKIFFLSIIYLKICSYNFLINVCVIIHTHITYKIEIFYVQMKCFLLCVCKSLSLRFYLGIILCSLRLLFRILLFFLTSEAVTVLRIFCNFPTLLIFALAV